MRSNVLALLLAAGSHFASADTTTKINAQSNWGTWQGWGTSLAWWAKAFGTRDDLADIFFTSKQTTFNGKSIPGLGFTIARYNAGACSTNSVDGERMVVSPNIPASRQIDGFWTDWKSNDTASSSWNWGVDASQRAMLTKAVARGADQIELFSNSPMWWMCTNHNPSGADNAGNNLQSWNYNQFAVYLASVAQYAKANWGVTFASVQPFNEPMANWWKASGTQEGCHFDVATQATVIGHMRSELDSRGLSGTIVAASDENSYDQARSTFSGLGSSAISKIGRVNVHGYQYDKGSRDGLYNAVSAAGKALWNSEYGENDATGRRLVSNLVLDFRWLRPTAWIYWQVLDGGGWGLIDSDLAKGTIGAVAQKYFLVAQFSRHIRAGMRILDGGASNVVAAYDAASKKLVVVAVNWDAAQTLNFDLSAFSQPSKEGAKVKRWRTQIGSGEQYVAADDATVSGGRFGSRFEKDMVQTFEVPDVVL